MQLVARQFLRALRGGQSQLGLARRLGYRGNPITDWERGASFPTARETLRVCECLGVDVGDALRRFANVPIERNVDGHRVGLWLRSISKVSPTELARRTGCARSSVSRWLSEESQPRLPEFLLLLDAMTGRISDFVASLVAVEFVPVLGDRHRASVAMDGLPFVAPWGEALLRLLETTAYQNRPRDDDWIASVLGLSLSEVSESVEALVMSGHVRRDGNRYVVARDEKRDDDDPVARLELESHWANVAADRALAPQRGDLHAYDIVSVSAADLQRIRGLVFETRREIRAIARASHPSERLALVKLHVFGWEAPDA